MGKLPNWMMCHYFPHYIPLQLLNKWFVNWMTFPIPLAIWGSSPFWTNPYHIKWTIMLDMFGYPWILLRAMGQKSLIPSDPRKKSQQPDTWWVKSMLFRAHFRHLVAEVKLTVCYWKMAIEIVDFPINKWRFSIVMLVYQNESHPLPVISHFRITFPNLVRFVPWSNNA